MESLKWSAGSMEKIHAIHYVFEQFSKLSEIGTEEEYAQYIENIFPESTYKDIVYHGTSKAKAEAIFRDGFEFSEKNEFTADIAGEGKADYISFTTKKDHAEFYAKKQDSPTLIYAVLDVGPEKATKTFEIINIYDPKYSHVLGSEQDIELFKKWKENR